MRTCIICYTTIYPQDEVEILLPNPSIIHKPNNILGRYKWFPSNYCFTCLEMCKSHIWKTYIHNLENAHCNTITRDILNIPIPLWLTDNMTINGRPIKALYYRGQMISSKLYTNMNDFDYYHLQEKIKKMQMEFQNGIQKAIHDRENITTIFQNMAI